MNILKVALQLARPSSAAEQLRDRCRGAIRALGDSALEARVQVNNSPEMVAWGIALDHAATNTQTGIFGTAASLGVLSISGQLSSVASPAARAIASWFPAPDSRYRSKGDFENTFKVSAYVGAIDAGSRLISHRNDFADWLVDSRLANAGWGCYYTSPDDRDPAPHLEPTARALLALRRYQPFFGSDDARSALQWLSSEVGSLRPMEPSIRAIGLYALVSFPDARGLVGEGYEKAVRQAGEQLYQSVRKWDGALSLYHHDYVVRRGHHNEPKYIDTSREIVVALALLASNYLAARDFVARCIAHVVAQIETQRAVRHSYALYTSQQLWAARLLQAAAEAAPEWLEPPELSLLRRHPVRVRLFALGILVVAGVPLSVLSLGDWPDKVGDQLRVGVLLVFGLVCAAGIVGLISQLVRRKW
jgi:hypothetical protein